MRFGTYYFLQRPPGAREADVVRGEVDLMVWSESLGFDSVWLTEHHFADYGISSAPSVLASAVFSRTERLRVGLAVYVLPFHDPIRFAEETATLDLLSGGRLTVGIGRGNRPAEYVGYRVAPEESRARFEEAHDLVLKAWTRERVEHAGRYWQIPGIPVHPRPFTQPHPPLAVAAATPETIDWTARHGYRLLSSGINTLLAASLETRARYDAALHAAGHDTATVARLLGQWTVTKHVYVAPTDAEARADARGPEEWYLDAFHRSLRLDGLPPLDEAFTARTERMRAGIAAQRWESLLEHALLVGSPETVRAKVAALQAAGVGELVCWTSFGGLPLDKVRRSMQLFASEVIPAFRTAPAPAT
ncbi:MAG TPA: LLM class flavin-dependent oxidoreductase [Chloroflexota bacterium]|jgi:alkanesulfonate monooxygenase SsuD/methylene tetrahydromethanopterin reductase-like flavin-dependent oxidoreductase (luciferase family)